MIIKQNTSFKHFYLNSPVFSYVWWSLNILVCLISQIWIPPSRGNQAHKRNLTWIFTIRASRLTFAFPITMIGLPLHWISWFNRIPFWQTFVTFWADGARQWAILINHLKEFICLLLELFWNYLLSQNQRLFFDRWLFILTLAVRLFWLRGILVIINFLRLL